MTLNRFVPSCMRRFARDERGVMTVHSLFMTLTCCAIGAAGLDVTHFYAARTELQVAADIAAHSALYLRRNGATEDKARDGAIRAVEYGMPEDTYGTVLETADIVFGTWDPETDSFKPLEEDSEVMPSAVQATTSRAGENPVGSFMFRVVGVDEMDVMASAVYTTVGDPCASMQGLFANGAVNAESGNTYSAGICVHSNDKVPFNNDNSFDLESWVSAPSISQISCAGNTENMGDKCPNLPVVRRETTYDLEQYLAPLRPSGSGAESQTDLLQDVKGALPEWNWTGISESIKTINSASEIEQGRVNYMNCGAGGAIELNGTYSNTVLLLNNCAVVIKKSNNVTLSDTIVYTTSTDKNNSFAVKGAGLRVGMDTDCDGSGMAALLTRGGFNTPAKTQFNNGVVRALLDVEFAAQFGWTKGRDSGSGLSIVAGNKISPTSNNSFIACPPSSVVGSAGPISFALAR